MKVLFFLVKTLHGADIDPQTSIQAKKMFFSPKKQKEKDVLVKTMLPKSLMLKILNAGC